jgi:hypothetical protein
MFLLLPIAELGGCLVKSARPGHEILDREGRQQLTARGQGIDAEVFGTADDPTAPQRLDRLAIPRAAYVGEAGHPADRLFTLGWTAAQEEVGDALFRDDVADVVAVDHDGREIEVQLLRHFNAVERLDEVRLHLLAEGLEHLHD